MSRVIIVVPQSIRQFTDGAAHIPVEAVTIREALEEFVAHSVDVRDHLFDLDGELRRFVRLFVNGEPATIEDESIAEGAEMVILFPLAGG